MSDLEFKLDTTELDRIIRDADVNADKIVRHLAFNMVGYARQLAPYVTTALKNSIYARTSKDDPYNQVAAIVKSKNPKAEIAPLPEPKEGEAYVGPCVAYGARVEFGFVGKDKLGRQYNQATHPYLTPALEKVKTEMQDGTTYREMVDPSIGADNDWLI